MPEFTEDLLQGIKEINLKSLQDCVSKGERFLTKVHLLGGDQNYVIMMPFKDDTERLEMLLEIGMMAYEKKAYQMIFVSEIIFKRYDNKDDFQRVLENQDTERPSFYPENMRSDGLMIYALDFKDDKKEKIIIIPYTTKDKIVTLEKEMYYSDDKKSRNNSQGLIKSVLAEGLTKAAMADILRRKEILPDAFFKMKLEDTIELLTEMKKELEAEYPNILSDMLQKK
jgi:hypothetical protein